ncbi:MAG TPA: hypothetical protein VKE96_10790 [Vicinamibacterales bacterium]|nr:hypothetical protein [Vicinamibacterales bacterium]
MISRRVRGGAILVGLLAALIGRLATDPSPIRLDTGDTNRDGRPDVWRYYGHDGVLLRVDVDTNFDGRSDIQESYWNGHLIRRESDRNFDDRIDRIDDFDAATGARTRSVVDTDFNGRADLLVLLSNGAPVYSWRASDPAPVPAAETHATVRQSDDSLLALDDPFSAAPSLRCDLPRLTPALRCADTRWTLTASPIATVALVPDRVPTSASRPVRSLEPVFPDVRGPPLHRI